MRKIQIFHTWWNQLAVEASCVSLETSKQKLCDFQSAVFSDTVVRPTLKAWSLYYVHFMQNRVITLKWAESYCYKINTKSKMCSSDCKYGISFNHKDLFWLFFVSKTYFDYSLFFKMGLFQDLIFVDNYTSYPNWDFQPVYRADQIKFLCFWATLNIINLNVRVKIFKLIPNNNNNKKKSMYGMWFLKNTAVAAKETTQSVTYLKQTV